jgi:hypothetical protein
MLTIKLVAQAGQSLGELARSSSSERAPGARVEIATAKTKSSCLTAFGRAIRLHASPVPLVLCGRSWAEEASHSFFHRFLTLGR